ncbi:unnamed protein product [Schistosoma mattheei]|uniref:Uncharacterized protein n=1 Tax=Schistosoma mattheei TaxID=31246 RepID=A0A183NDJ5_9TREM|nr:unnamed protein product [Schistosoma mattheei]
MNLPAISTAPTDLPTTVTPITIEEIGIVIIQIESGKATGPENIPAEELKSNIEATMKDQRTGFRKDQSCTDQIVTLRIIVEQSVEWNSSLYINFIDYEKAFDSVDKRTLWKLLQHYGVPQKIVNIIQNSYGELQCKGVQWGTADRCIPKEVETLEYLGSTTDEQEGSDADVNARIGKAGIAFLQLKNIWNSKQLSASHNQSHNLQYGCQGSSTVWS